MVNGRDYMANKRTRALTKEEFFLLIETIRQGFSMYSGVTVKPNARIATALVIEGNLGIRIGDIVHLRLSDIIRDGNRYRLNIIEQKTGKKREFTVPSEIYTFLQSYSLSHNISPNQKLFSLSVRAIQKHLSYAADRLGLENIGTHSLRKYFAMEIYNSNGYNVELVRHLLQHSSVAVTQHYLSVQPQLMELALANHIHLPT